MRVDIGAGDGVDEGEEGGVGGGGGVFGGRGEEEFGADGGGEGDDLDAEGLGEDLFCYCACGDARWRVGLAGSVGGRGGV